MAETGKVVSNVVVVDPLVEAVSSVTKSSNVY